MSAGFRGLSIGGFGVAVVAASLLALGSGRPWLFDLPALVGPGIGVAALLLHAWAVARRRVREEAAAFALAALALLPFAQAVPTAAEWILAALAAAGFLLAVEMAGAARRLAKLEAAEGREAHIERVEGPLRNAILVPLAAITLLMLLGRPLGRATLGLAGEGLGASLEASGLYGTALGAGLLATLLGLAAYVRHLRQDA